MNDLISVIVPIYNVEKYLEKCLKSICNQTYHNLDIVLVDDGSTDNSSTICDNYTQKDKRIQTIHKKNGGLSDARNCGISHSKGDYLIFVDSDDYIDLDMIKMLYNNLIEMDADISVCGYNMIYNNRVVPICDGKTRVVYSPLDALKVLLKRENMGVIACNKLYKKGIFHNVRYPVGQHFEDINTTYKLIVASHKIVYTPRPMYYYVQRETSINGMNFQTQKFNDKLYDMETAADELLNFVATNYSNAETDVSIGCLDYYLRIIDQEILFGIDNAPLIKKAKILAKKYILSIFTTQNINLKKKIQILIFITNLQLYKTLIKFLKGA